MRSGSRSSHLSTVAPAQAKDPDAGGRIGVRRWWVMTLLGLLASDPLHTESLHLVHRQRYCMGTMFDIVAYHPSREDAERAVVLAMAEIARLDQVMSHFKADSDLAKLVREAPGGFVTVEPSLYAVLQESMTFSRLSGGRFDVTIAPLLRAWRVAREEGRRPTTAEISAARRCVGFEKIEARDPDRIRLHSDCLDIDLGGIGKGYAVDRATSMLRAAGIRHATINAGSSSIAFIGTAPGRQGWPTRLPGNASGPGTLWLKDLTISTSQQNGEILDPSTGVPAASEMTVSVIAPSATVSDALSTTLLVLSVREGRKLLSDFSHVSAFWISPAGELKTAHRASEVGLSGAR
jgi:FAD:protein FMN transferase